MNLDKLKSLIRLANNNPNENEANLAARKVCKIIAEENFKLLNGNSHQPQQQNAPRTWNDVTRSTEPFWRNADWVRDFYYRAHTNPFYEREVKVDFDTETKKTKPPKTMRVCTECGVEKETRNQGIYYICAACHWKKYHKTRNEDIDEATKGGR